MRCKITSAATPKPQAVPDAVNGNVPSPNLTRLSSVLRSASEADAAFDNQGVPSTQPRGMKAEHLPGKRLPNGLRVQGIRARLLSEGGGKALFEVEVKPAPTHSGYTRWRYHITVSTDPERSAMEALRSALGIMSTPTTS